MASYEQTRIHLTNRFDPGVHLNDTYRLDERIASGGMGDVYRGHNIETGEPVAIKTVRPELVGDDKIFELFKKEGMILGRLNHPTIVRYYSFSRDPKIGRPYLVMEFVEGQSLAERMKVRPLSVEEARQLFGPVADGLALAHKAGVIHRDLSPDNVILQHDNVADPKIIDFGIARATSSGEHTILGGSFAGKFSFASPEQLGLHDRQVTNRSDIYSMGLVMVAALRGKPLDMGSSPAEVIERRGMVPDLSDIDISFRTLVAAMLQPDPESRPRSMTQIAHWLKLSADEAETVSFDSTIPRIGQSARDAQPGGQKRTPPVLETGIENSSPRGRRNVVAPPIAQPRGAAPIRPSTKDQFVEHVSPVLKGRTILRTQEPGPAAKGAGNAKPSRAGLVAGVFLVLTAVAGASTYFTDLIDFKSSGTGPTVNDDKSFGADTGESVPTKAPQSAASSQTDHAGPVTTESPLANGKADHGAPADSKQAKVGIQVNQEDVSTHVEDTPPNAKADQDSASTDARHGDQGDLKVLQPDAGKTGNTEPISSTAMAATGKADDGTTGPLVALGKATTPEEANTAPIPNPDECFFAVITAQSDDAMTIKGVGLSMAPFDRIKSALASSGSGAARMDDHIITARQCPVTTFLKTLHDTADDNPNLNFTNLGGANETVVTGSVANVGSRMLRLFAIDGKGMLFDLQDDTITANTPPLFKLTFDGARANFAPPGIIVALTSGGPIDLGRAGTGASGLPALAETLAARGDVTGIDFGYFPYDIKGRSSAQ